MKWLACRRVPSPPIVTTRSTSLMGCVKSFRCTAFHSTDFFCRISWQKFMESWCTLFLLFKKCKTCNFLSELKLQMTQKIPIMMPTVQVKYKPKPAEISLSLDSYKGWDPDYFPYIYSSSHNLTLSHTTIFLVLDSSSFVWTTTSFFPS